MCLPLFRKHLRGENVDLKQIERPFEILGVKFEEREYAIDIGVVEMIVEKTDITPVPNSKDFIKGVMNLRGRIVPVVDLKKILNTHQEDGENFNVIVTKVDETEVGFLVDGVTEVMWVDPSNLNSSIKVEESKYFKGIIQKENRIFAFIDIPKFVRDEINDDYHE